jgi:hypothetical protein
VIAQLIPAAVTLPFPVLPAPAVTVTVWLGGAAKLADTLSACVTVTVQVVLDPEDAHAPPQPRNVLAPVGAAVNVTLVP